MAYTACRLASATGMKLGEIRALTVEQIRQDEKGQYFIRVDSNWADLGGRKSTKSGYTRIVPICKELYDLLMSISTGSGLIFSLDGKNPVKDTTITDKLKAKMLEAGIPYDGRKLSFHSFRNTMNTWLVAHHISGELTRAIMGHERKEMTDHYLNLKNSDMATITNLQESLLKAV